MERLFTRNFTLLVLGQLISLFGTGILKLAVSMYVLEATGSAAVFAGLLSAATVPAILLSPLGGILADRVDRRNIMAALDALNGAAVLCAARVLSGSNAVAVLGALLVLLSVLGAFETPAVQACIPAMLRDGNIMRGNAVVNQAAALSSLAAPMLGGALYAVFGLRPLLYAAAVCYFATALFECFIDVGRRSVQNTGGAFQSVRRDLLDSMRYIAKEQASIGKMLLLTALSRFFVMGATIVGLPFLVRTVLGLSAGYYGGAESALAVAAMIGSAAAGGLAERLRTHQLSMLLASLGFFLLSAGAGFLLPVGSGVKYAVLVVSFCAMQAAVSAFSVFAVSLIQQRTPDHFLGKVMSYTAAVTLCAQPLGQIVYGFLFDQLRGAVYAVLLPTGVIVCAVGLSAGGFFRSMEEEGQGRTGRT